MTEGLLSRAQLFTLGLLATLPTGILAYAGIQLRLGDRFAWYTPLLAAVPVSLAAYLGGASAVRHGDLVQAASSLLKRYRASLLLPLWAGIAWSKIIISREFIELASHSFATGAPPTIIVILFGSIPFLPLVLLRPAVIGRVSTGVAIAVVATYAAVLLLSLGSLHVNWALPLIPTDTRFLSADSFLVPISWLEVALMTLTFVAYVEPSDRPGAGRTIALAIIIVAALASLGLWIDIAYFGPARARGLVVPFISLAREETFGTILRNLDTFVLPIEIMGLTLKASIMGLALVRVTEGIVGFNHRWIVIPALLALVDGVPLVAFPNDLYLSQFSIVSSPMIEVLLFGSGILIYALAAWRRVPAPA